MSALIAQRHRRSAGAFARKWLARMMAVAAFAGMTGCDNAAGNAVFQAAGATGRTITDMVLTSYANVVAGFWTTLQTALGG